jgi:hypothetical protein
MPETYSINLNTVFEANRLATVTEILYELPDNTSKLITPNDVRDAIYSAWEESVFKQTTGSASVEYIGIDRNDIREKILIGKKQLAGLDVLNSTLLDYTQNDTDIFFFNNKPGITPSNTKISFLAGTNSLLYNTAPYFNSYPSTSSTINLDIVNNSGDIIFDSATGLVSINDVVFPTKLQTSSASNGQVLVYNNGSLIWSDNTINIATIGSTTSVTNIYGSPVLVNGYDIELNATNPIMATFGNIKIGQTFSNAPIVEVVRQMLYPYIPPQGSVLVDIGGGFTTSAVAEINSKIFATVSWSMTKNSDPIISASLSNTTGFSPPTFPFTSLGQTISMSPPYGTGATATITPYTYVYDLDISDNGISNWTLNDMSLTSSNLGPTTIQASASLDLVYPIFYGVYPYLETTGASVSSILSSLNKLVDHTFENGTSSKYVNFNGSGYIYFCYSASASIVLTASAIFDPNGFDITGSFTSSTINLNSPNVYWTNIEYNILRYGPVVVNTRPNPWQFRF